MKVNPNPRIWEFDTDNTLILWDLSKYPEGPFITVQSLKGPVTLVPNQKNINLLVKLSKIGWHIRVKSGSGVEWAEKVIRTLGLESYVDEVESRPLGLTDDGPPGEGLAYRAYRDPRTGEE